MRLIIVSNRLPFTAARNERGDLRYKNSVGGLATGIASYLESAKIDEHVWVGWPGLSIPTTSCRRKLKKDAVTKFSSLPVFLPKNAAERFYNGFCNKTLYP